MRKTMSRAFVSDLVVCSSIYLRLKTTIKPCLCFHAPIYVVESAFYYDTARIFSKIPNCQDINDIG